MVLIAMPACIGGGETADEGTSPPAGRNAAEAVPSPAPPAKQTARATASIAAAPKPRALGGGPDSPHITWVPASPRVYERANRSDSQIQRIVVHVAQGSAEGTVTWFRNRDAGASSHYVVSAKGDVTHMVPDRSIAWHAGNRRYNATSIGIEHEGFVARKSSFTEPLYRASAQLVGTLAKKYGIKLDRQHVIGHHEVPDPDDPGRTGGSGGHTDPGPHWKWEKYMRYVHTYAREGKTAVPANAARGTRTNAPKQKPKVQLPARPGDRVPLPALTEKDGR